MVVYSSSREKYVLSARPAFSTSDGDVYDVKGNRSLQVKLYKKAYRTAAKQQEVIETINGECGMMGEFPNDLIYANGRFAGYLTERQASFEPEPSFDMGMTVPSKPDRGPANQAVTLLLSLIFGIIGSAVIYFLVFDALRSNVEEIYCYWNFNGIPMILLGWVGLLAAYFCMRQYGYGAVLGAALAFVVASGLTFALISALVWLLITAANLFMVIMPSLITIGVIIWLVKTICHS